MTERSRPQTFLALYFPIAQPQDVRVRDQVAMGSFRQIVIAGTVLALAGCGSSGVSLNPATWFAADDSVEMVDTAAFETQVDPRPMVPIVTALTIDRLPGGVIVRATALPAEQGWFDSQLVAEASSDASVRLYSFRGNPPEDATRVSTQQSRELTAATYLSDIELQGIRTIQVVGATNSRAVRP